VALSALFELAQKAGRKYGDEVIDYLQDFLGGLPPETADRLVRASEQGYDVTTPYYHGTGSPDITMFQGERGSAGHFSRDPKFAENFAYEKEGAPAIYPVYLRHGKQFNVKIPEDLDVLRNHLRSVDISLGEEEAFQRMKLGLADYTDLERLAPRIREAGFNSYVDYEDIGGGPTGIAVFDPSDVRSVNAEFNPKRTKSGNILAGGAAAAVGIGAGTQSNEAEAGMLDMGLRTVAKPIERALRSADMERAVVRGAREVLPRTAPISAGEKSAILADIEKAGIGDPKEVMKLARDTRARFPSSGVNEPWSPFEITGVKVKQDKNGKITYDLKTKNIAYGFHVDPRTGKEAKRNSAYYQNMVNGVADEIIAVARLAENGDPAAKRIMENAGWYKNVEGRGFNEYGSFYDMFGDLLGATSPNTPVRTNFNFSNDILQRFSRGEFDDQIERYANSMDRVDELDALMAGIENTAKETPGMTVKVAKSSPEYKAYAAESASIKESLKEDSIRQAAREDYVFKGGKMKIKPVSEGKKYGINSDNAMVALADRWRIFRKGDAPKAKNFSGNLVGYSLAPTIDVWAARNLRRHAGMPPVPGVAEQGVTGQIIDPETFKNSLEFGFGQDVVSDATKKINDVLGLNLDPRDTQALQWFVEKDYWSKRGMTSAAGEGGSFETMMDLNPVESMVVGTSRAQSVDTQGVDFIPGPKDQLQAAKRFMGTAAEDPDVIAGKALTTKGMYKFGDETSFDIDIVSKEDMVPASTLDEVAKQAAADKQESFFAARRIKPEVGDARPELFNVGSEAYFKTPVSPDSDDVRNLYTFLTERDIPGFTLIMDPRQKPGEMAQKVIGVRFLDIPQFYDAERFANMSDAEYADHVRKTFTQYDDIGRQIEQDFGNIRTARPGYFDVNVKSRGSAEAYLAQLQNRQRDPDALRQEYWGFKPARSRFQEYAGQAQPYYLKGGESPVPATRAERAALKASQGGYADPAAILATAAVTAPAADFLARRQQKSERNQSMRQSILDLLGQADELGAQVRESLMSGLGTANRYAGLALEAPQVPIRGIQGLTALAGDITAGQEPLSALSRAAAVSQQSPEQNAYEAGGAVTDATGSPLLGTAAYLLNRGLEFASPY